MEYHNPINLIEIILLYIGYINKEIILLYWLDTVRSSICFLSTAFVKNGVKAAGVNGKWHHVYGLTHSFHSLKTVSMKPKDSQTYRLCNYRFKSFLRATTVPTFL